MSHDRCAAFQRRGPGITKVGSCPGLYADEVASALIPVLTNLGNELVGKPETIPFGGLQEL
jgi:hypothetical protein